MEDLLASISFYLEIESRLSDSFMRRILKHILTKAILVFCFIAAAEPQDCLLYTSPSPRDVEESRMPSSA